MIESGKKTSLFIPSQLPEFIRDDPDYANFVSFIQAYYEWMEQNNNVLDRSKNIQNYDDIDRTTDEFINYYTNDFLPNFPQETLVDKNKLVKLARELYQSKGTPASYQFLFRVLYNSDFDVYYTNESVLKPSDGVWYIPKSLKLATSDPRFLNIKNYRVFGEKSKSIATIENSVFAGNKIEIFISNIERLFQSGENVRIVDHNNQDVFINGNSLKSKIVGQISRVSINPAYKGQYYAVGDPVIVDGGLASTSANPKGAIAQVAEVTKGSIDRMTVIDGGYGYAPQTTTVQYNIPPENYANSQMVVLNAPGSVVVVGSIDSTKIANATLIPADSIALKSHLTIGSLNFNFESYNIKVSPPVNYAVGETVFQGTSLLSNTFSSTVVAIDSPNNTLSIANTGYYGNISNNYTLYGNTSGAYRTLEGYVSRQANLVFSLTADQYELGETVRQVDQDYVAIVSNVDQTNNIIRVSFANGLPTVSANIVGSNTGRIRTVNSYTSSNANTRLVDAFSFYNYATYPISSVNVINGGGGIVSQPVSIASSLYATDNNKTGDLKKLGILAPIKIVNPGVGYRLNDTVVITGGSGLGAKAKVTALTANSGISQIDYIQDTNSLYPLGGMGYALTSLPTITVSSANNLASNVVLSVPGILGDGSSFSVSSERIGSITKISLLDNGEDYIAIPSVSLKVEDIVVSNVSLLHYPTTGDVIYQGDNINVATYRATVNSVSTLQSYSDPTQTLYNLRVFNYNSRPNPNLTMKIDRDANISITMANTKYSDVYDDNGINVYGDGKARATASFLNGLVLGDGMYLNNRGQPSGSSVLQSDNYNNFTYKITVEKEIEKYRQILLNLLHPNGTHIIGRYAVKSNSKYQTVSSDAFYEGQPLRAYTGYTGSTVSMYADFVNKSNNLIKFNNLSGANIANFIFSNSIVQIKTQNGPNVKCEVISVDYTSNTVTLKNNTWLTYANVAVVTANSGSNVINIKSITDSYDIINNGQYSNTQYPLMDVIFAGDKISIANNTTKTVNYVDFIHGKIYLTTNITSNSNSYLSVNRTFVPTSCVVIFGPIGTEYIPELTTETGLSITTEDNRIILVG